MVYFVQHGLWDKLKRNIVNALQTLGCSEVSEYVDENRIYVWGKLPFAIQRQYIYFDLPRPVYEHRVFIYLAESVDQTDASMTGEREIYDSYGGLPHGYLITAINNETFVFRDVGGSFGWGVLITAVDGYDGKQYCYVRSESDTSCEELHDGDGYRDCDIDGLGSRLVALDGKLKASSVIVRVSNVAYGVARNLIYVDFSYDPCMYSPLLKVGTDYYDVFCSCIGYKVNTENETVD